MMNKANPHPADWAPPSGLPQPTNPTPTVMMGGPGPLDNTWGFDPTDYESWPYGFGDDLYAELIFDPLTEESIETLDLRELLPEVCRIDDPTTLSIIQDRRTMEMALRLFLHLASDTLMTNRAFDPRVAGLSHSDIFAACLDTALIWERG